MMVYDELDNYELEKMLNKTKEEVVVVFPKRCLRIEVFIINAY